jgi:hypothetical protein
VPVRVVRSTQYVDCTRNRLTESIELDFEGAAAAFTVHGSFVPMSAPRRHAFDPRGLLWDVTYDVAYFTPLTHRDKWEKYGIDSKHDLIGSPESFRTISASRVHRLVEDPQGLTLFARRGSGLDVEGYAADQIARYIQTRGR